jgi:hypothetical protein
VIWLVSSLALSANWGVSLVGQVSVPRSRGALSLALVRLQPETSLRQSRMTFRAVTLLLSRKQGGFLDSQSWTRRLTELFVPYRRSTSTPSSLIHVVTVEVQGLQRRLFWLKAKGW